MWFKIYNVCMKVDFKLMDMLQIGYLDSWFLKIDI